jgi:hypothetical protein
MFNRFFSENRAIYEIMWKNMIQPDRAHMTVRCMRFAFWITKATDTNSVHVKLTGVHRQKCIVESATCYVFTYFNCLVNCLVLLFALLLSIARLSRGEGSLCNYRSVVTRNLILSSHCNLNLQFATEIHLELF